MNTLRWLVKNPIALAWVLAGIAILLNMGSGHHEAAEEQGKAEQHAVAEHTEKGDKHVSKHDKHAEKAEKHAEMAHEGKMEEHAAPTEAKAADMPATEVMTPAEPVKPEVLLKDARQAYWDGAIDAAIASYKELIKQQPDVLSHKGELANIYWKQGKTKEAAELFVVIAPQLAAQGRDAEALNMKVYVDMVDPELAKKIDAELKK